jgi:coatomer protein complex subunit epsilon
MKLIMLTNPA